MSEPTNPEPGAELEVDLSAFLPEGVILEGGSEQQQTADLEPDDHDAIDAVPDDADPDEHPDVDADPAAADVAEATPPMSAPQPPVDDSIDLDLIEAVDADLGAVEAALAALDDGTYGTCAVCRAAIDAELLASDPVRRTCPTHS